MKQRSFESWLSALTIAVVVGCLALLTGTLLVLVSPQLRGWLGFSAAPATYELGERIDLPVDAYSQSPLTLVVFLRASCPACESIRPELAHFVKQQAGSDRLRVIVAAPRSRPEQQAAYTATIGLSGSDLYPVDFRLTKVRAVPTAALVNQEGVILALAEGAREPFTQLLGLVLEKAGL